MLVYVQVKNMRHLNKCTFKARTEQTTSRDNFSMCVCTLCLCVLVFLARVSVWVIVGVATCRLRTNCASTGSTTTITETTVQMYKRKSYSSCRERDRKMEELNDIADRRLWYKFTRKHSNRVNWQQTDRKNKTGRAKTRQNIQRLGNYLQLDGSPRQQRRRERKGNYFTQEDNETQTAFWRWSIAVSPQSGSVLVFVCMRVCCIRYCTPGSS